MNQEIYRLGCWGCLRAKEDLTEKYVCPKYQKHLKDYELWIEKQAETKWYQIRKEKRYQKFLLRKVIQCLFCGGTMKKKQLGYDCLNCENFLKNEEIWNEL